MSDLETRIAMLEGSLQTLQEIINVHIIDKNEHITKLLNSIKEHIFNNPDVSLNLINVLLQEIENKTLCSCQEGTGKFGLKPGVTDNICNLCSLPIS